MAQQASLWLWHRMLGTWLTQRAEEIDGLNTLITTDVLRPLTVAVRGQGGMPPCDCPGEERGWSAAE